MARVEAVQDERLPPEVYHELAEQILEAGRLDGRAWVREVEVYLEERRLLELARADGWACLPGLNWLLQIAEEVHTAVSSQECLIRAKLAQYNKRGEFVPTWGRWRLVIPWRGPDGRISALQKRRTWKHVPKGKDDPEPAKYVLPWSPEWPYGSERVGEHERRANKAIGGGIVALPHGSVAPSEERGRGWQESQGAVALGSIQRIRGGSGSSGNEGAKTKIAIVEGAVDTLAMRAMHPGFVVLGIPGINNWRSSWAGLVAATVQDFRTVRFALDRGKPDPNGIVPEDRVCARIALDCAGRGQERDAVLDWLISRHRRGKTLFCVLCGAPELWLCRGCGRRRAPVGQDWGMLWETQSKKSR